MEYEDDFLTVLSNEFDRVEDVFETAKLNKKDWIKLRDQLEITPEKMESRNEMYASGEHYNVNLLLMSFGFYGLSETDEIMDAAWRLVSNGYK